MIEAVSRIEAAQVARHCSDDHVLACDCLIFVRADLWILSSLQESLSHVLLQAEEQN